MIALPHGCRHGVGGVSRVLVVLACLWVLAPGPARAQISVRIAGPGGAASQSLPDAGGTFALDLPLTKNSVNTINVMAEDVHGNRAARDLVVTQVSLADVVISEFTSEPLPPEQVMALVNEGVIDLNDPENYNVSQFNIVLTIGPREVPISVPIAIPIEESEESGSENIQLPWGEDAGGAPNQMPPVEVIVFEEGIGSVGDVPLPPVPGVLIIEGRIKSLKEFFRCRLLLMNASGIFTLSNVAATLSFPDGGLSHVLPKDGVASFGDILPGDGGKPGQVEKEFIIRGDEMGVRGVKVNFGGFVSGPGIPEGGMIPFSGSAKTTVEVKGPPSFQVAVTHPDDVEAGVPYELKVAITNTGEVPALYASLELDLAGSASLMDCTVDGETGETVCAEVDKPVTRSLGHLYPGATVCESYVVTPKVSGRVSSCMGVSSQNVSLQVVVGNIGCQTGHFAPERGVPSGMPTVTVLPGANATGVGLDAPVVALFSEAMDESTITKGATGTIRVTADDGTVLPGRLTLDMLNGKSVATWQFEDGVTNRWKPNAVYHVQVTQGCRDTDGNALFNEWRGTFTTTGEALDDTTAPALTLAVQPPVVADYVLPGQLVQLNAYASDQGSGVVRVEARLKDVSVADSVYVLIDQKSVLTGQEPPYFFTIDSANLVPGHAYQVLGTAYDYMGNMVTATAGLVVAASASTPVVALPEPAAQVLHGISVDVTPVSVSPGVRVVRFYLDGGAEPFATSELAPWQVRLGTLGLPLGAHTVRAVAADGLEQTGEDAVSFELIENVNMPSVSFGAAVDGGVYRIGDVVPIQAGAEDPTGIASVAFYLDGAAAPIASGLTPFVVATEGLAPGNHYVTIVATNHVGVANDPDDAGSILEFVVVEPPPGAPPAAPVVTSLTAPVDGVARLDGTSVAGTRVDVSNAALGILLSVTASGSGAFTAAVPARAGDVLTLVAYDFSQSPEPSAPAQAIVPAPRVLSHITCEPASISFDSFASFREIVVTAHYEGGATGVIAGEAAYSSSAPGVASVDAAGRVAPISNGDAVITVTAQGKTAEVAVHVAVVTLTGVTVSPEPVTLAAVNQTQALSVTGHYSDGSEQPLVSGVSFTTGDGQVATVNASGVVRATGAGITVVTVLVAGAAPVLVDVLVDTAGDPAPAAAITSPADGAVVERGATVNVMVQGTDTLGGVTRLHVTVSGAATYSRIVQVSPPALSTLQPVSFEVPLDAPMGGAIAVTAYAEDTGGNLSAAAAIGLVVGDKTDPAVTVTGPAPQSEYNYGDVIALTVEATDAVGVAQIRYATSGAFERTGSQAINPATGHATATFQIPVPYGLPDPSLRLLVWARDAAGNEGHAVPVDVVVTSADITAPATEALAASASGATAVTVITYEVTEGLDDLDHVELYFRRNALGTFNRYTRPDAGNAEGAFVPESGAMGTIAFDSTRMGGDGSFEFYTIGVDVNGNRENPPEAEAKGAVDADETAEIRSGTVWREITDATTIDAGDASYDEQNLRITGATVVVAGHHAFHNVELLAGAVLRHPETDMATEYGLDISVWTLSVDGDSVVDVSGGGYLGGKHAQNDGSSGRTAGNEEGATFRSSGSYGGPGGQRDGVTNAQYGNLVMPADLGSGGSRGWYNEAGGDGGGRVYVQAINVVADGDIVADGTGGGGSAAGSGSGGSVYVVTGTLSGEGLITANGGAGDQGGGGGRIAIHYVDMATKDTSRIVALGGQGSHASGGNGTVFLKGMEDAGGTLVVDGQGVATQFAPLPIPAGYVFDDIILRNGARVLVDTPLVVEDSLRVETGSVLTHSTRSETGLQVEADHVYVDATSSIDVSSRGYRGGKRDGNDSSNGETLGGLDWVMFRSAGSYGGYGGVRDGSGSNVPYGQPLKPVYLGSGGSRGWYNEPGGNGGGRVTVVARKSLWVEGAILANGGAGGGSSAGSGSGGSILIDTSLLKGTGVIAADGGGGQVGGGGGRICVTYDFAGLPGSDLAGTRNISAFGGRGTDKRGGAGTVVLQRRDQTWGDLYVDDGVADATSPVWTPLTPIGTGQITALTEDTLTTDGSVRLLPNGLAGIYLNPNLSQGQTFRIVSNTETAITVETEGLPLTEVASVGDTYAAVYAFDNVFFRRGGFLVTGDCLMVADTLRLDEYGVLTHFDADLQYEPRLYVEAGTVDIAATGAVDLDVRGYLGGKHNHDGTPGRTVGNVEGATFRAAGSHGGTGSAWDGASNAAYDSVTMPLELGASGSRGWYNESGGDGGGRARIVADSVVVNGELRANGGNGGGSLAGSGAGGSIVIDAGVLSGSGFVRANGGGYQMGGGGGRIALYCDEVSLDLSHVEVLGGQGTHGVGGNGTLYVRRPGQTHGDFIVDGGGLETPQGSTVFPDGYVFDNIILRHRAQVLADVPVHVLGALQLLDGSVLTHTLSSEAGLQVVAGFVDVDASSTITAFAKGYRGGKRDGNDSSAGLTVGNVEGAQFRSAGSHGGYGANYDGTTNTLYGDAAAPVALGSGGSRGWYNEGGGNGGGRIRIVADTIAVAGSVVADGSTGAGSHAGSGSGGSIWITVGTLSGDGTISANGGGHDLGGGGGRIAIYYDSLAMDESHITVLGGRGSHTNGGNGTLYLMRAGQALGDLIIDGAGYSTPAGSSMLAEGAVYDNIILRNGAQVLADTPIVATGALRLLNGSVITHTISSEAGIEITAGAVEVDATSWITASGRGYRGGKNSGNEAEYGLTLDGLPGASFRSAGSYGGLGASKDGAANPAYGHPAQPVYLGSGGSRGWYNEAGGNGGGRIHVVAGSLAVAGGITADGTDGGGSNAGSGSGGSIWIQAGHVGGSGIITANGGGRDLGGGGGRVLIEYETFGGSGQDFAERRSITAFGGVASQPGSAGTVLFIGPGQTYGDLYVDANVAEGTAAAYTPLPHIGFGACQAVTADTLTVDGRVAMIPNGLTGVEINPNVLQGETYTIVANTETEIVVDTAGKPALTEVAAPGDTYAGQYRFDNVYFRRGGALVMGDLLEITGEMRIAEYGLLTHYDATTAFESRLELTAGTVFVDGTGRIDVSARGYLGGRHDGAGPSGRTEGNVDGSTYRSAGSYGGLGANREGVANPVYGDALDPRDLGSGGSAGAYNEQGGDGGGCIILNVAAIVVDGAVRADGDTGKGSSAGGGSGGSVNIVAGAISGAGVITASGGGNDLGGGGGRMVIRAGGNTLGAGQVAVSGGAGYHGNGAAGTIFFLEP